LSLEIQKAGMMVSRSGLAMGLGWGETKEQPMEILKASLLVGE
jgi:hypothetical protein